MDIAVVFFVPRLGAYGVVWGFAVLLNLFGAADRAAARNREAATTRRASGLLSRDARRDARVGADGDGRRRCADHLRRERAVGRLDHGHVLLQGAPARVLTVTVGYSVGEIRRHGAQIEVREQGEGPARCSGDAPTVHNTDTIKIVLVDVSFVDLDLGGGAFAPGATPEAEGASEIEIELSLDLGAADVFGTRRRRRVALGPPQGPTRR